MQVAGYGWIAFLKADGEVLSCASNQPAARVPTLAPGSGIVQIAAGLHHGLALRSDGTVLSWGFDHLGALGNPDDASRPVPEPVALPPGAKVVRIAAGAGQSYALRADGSVLAWGTNTSGVLGTGDPNGARVELPKPVAIPEGLSVRDLNVSPQGAHALAIVGVAPSEPPTPTLRLDLGDATVREDAGEARLTLTLSGPSRVDTTVAYEGGSATPHLGETSTTIVVPVADDQTDEEDEVRKLHLSVPSANVGVEDGEGVVTILDDDDPHGRRHRRRGRARGRHRRATSAALPRAARAAVRQASGRAVAHGTRHGDDGRRLRGAPRDRRFAPGETDQAIDIDVFGDVRARRDRPPRGRRRERDRPDPR